MGRLLAHTVVVNGVTYLADTEVDAEVAAQIGNPKAFADEVDDTSADDVAAAERARLAYDAGRPIRQLSEDELRAWAYEPESPEGREAEEKLLGLERGDAPEPAGGHPPVDPDPDGDPSGDPAGDPADPDEEDEEDDDDPVDVIDFSDAPPREGRGSGVQAWRTYAEGKGLTVPADADRDAIVELVDARIAAQTAAE